PQKPTKSRGDYPRNTLKKNKREQSVRSLHARALPDPDGQGARKACFILNPFSCVSCVSWIISGFPCRFVDSLSPVRGSRSRQPLAEDRPRCTRTLPGSMGRL